MKMFYKFLKKTQKISLETDINTSVWKLRQISYWEHINTKTDLFTRLKHRNSKTLKHENSETDLLWETWKLRDISLVGTWKLRDRSLMRNMETLSQISYWNIKTQDTNDGNLLWETWKLSGRSLVGKIKMWD
jgi:hypothetical protein